MNPGSDEIPVLPLDELSITPQWIKFTGKSYDHYTGGDGMDHKRPRGRRDRSREREGGPRPPRTGKPEAAIAGKPGHRPDSRPSAPGHRRLDRPDKGRSQMGKGSPHEKGQRHPLEHRPAPATIEVSFVPEQERFTAMLDALKQSARAYAFFDIARLILNKPERHLVKLAGKPSADGARAPLWLVLPSENPFLTRDEAVRFLLGRHTYLLWKEVRTPVDPPKGSFTFVNRCGFTGELLGPPNHHEYQTRLVRHWKERLAHMSFDRFKMRIETIKSPEAVKKWLEQMSSKIEYECRCCAPTPSESASAVVAPVEPANLKMSDATMSASPEQPAPQPAPPPKPGPRFATREEIEKHILANHLDRFVVSAAELQISGPASRRIAHEGIHEAVRQAWETEWGFPLKTATNFQTQLRQGGFHFFKDRKGITYISRIRLKRFEAGQVLTENIQKIVSFLHAHEGATRKRLLATLAPPAKAAATPVAVPAESNTVAPTTETIALAAPETTPAPEAAALAPSPMPAAVVPVSSPEEEQILRDLHWLIADGFVVELFNGRLWMPPEKQPPPASSPAVEPVPASASTEAVPAVPAEAPAGPAVDGAALVSPQETAGSPTDVIPPESSLPAPTTESSPASS